MGKVSIQELAALLVDRAGLNKKEATTFIGAIFDLVQQALETEKIVKIKGLGTFKIIDVDDRESVNVNTGERVLIEGHGKITFAPDSIIKELVNKPFSQFDTVVLNDGVDFDDDLPPESRQNSEPVMQPVIEPVLKPVVEPVSQPIVKPASQPIIEPASQPEPEPASVFQTKVSQEEPTEMPLVDFVDERQTEENLSLRRQDLNLSLRQRPKLSLNPNRKIAWMNWNRNLKKRWKKKLRKLRNVMVLINGFLLFLHVFLVL